ncbi:MAG: SpoIIE family protein phosphatase [Bernardetiaceae bacterium]|nr:SpoIIE family protein phosphatase [Bernardetiaceae bacterium]
MQEIIYKDIKLSETELRHIFEDIYRKSDKILNYLLLIQFLFGLAIAPFYDTWIVALVVGSASVGLYYAAKWIFPQSNFYQYVLSFISAVFAAQYIYQMHGMFEMHFWVFISSTVLITYQNWRLQLPLIITVIIHHGTFAYLQYIGIKEIYFTQLAYMDLVTFFFHGLLATAVTFVSAMWGYMLRKQTIKDAIYARVLNQQREQLAVAIERNQAYTEELKQTAEELHARNEQLSRVNKLLQKQNLDIHSSIQYAQRIQEALLPNQERLHEIFPQSFVFYRPRDVVSGDFFWVDEIKGKKILVVGDCTGHGVPGAFMSLIGINFLYQIIRMEEITSPAEILARLRTRIYKALKQDSTGNTDGMDASVVVVDSQAQTITFAGAKSAIVIFDQHGNFQLLKGDKIGIGGEKRSLHFHNHVEFLCDKIFLYAFTDGYRDQIGGKEKRKLGSNGFCQLLASIWQLPTEMQTAQLHHFIDQWQQQGNEKQLDDMLVVGIKLKA